MPITSLDIIVLVLMLLSAMLAMVRGFVREVLSIASWGIAAYGAVMAYLTFKDDVRAQLQPDIMADGILIVGSFLLVLIIVSFITMKISDFILDSKVGVLDRTLGFIFGAARGLLLVVVAMLFFNWLAPSVEDQPRWIVEAKSKPLIDNLGKEIMDLLPNNAEEIIEDLKDKAKGGKKSAGEAGGYSNTQTQGMKQLLETVQ